MTTEERVRLAGILLDLAGRWRETARDQDTDHYAAAVLEEAAAELRVVVADELLP